MIMLKRRIFWALLIVLLLAAGVGAAALKKKNHSANPTTLAATAPATLEFLASDVTMVKPRDLRRTLGISGSLRAVNQAAVKAKVPGEVREVLVREGEPVTAGQVLAKMDASEYQARVDQAKGALEAAQGQL